jgi:hypothetical protein
VTDARFRKRAIGQLQVGLPDHVMECQRCGALVVEDGAVMERHVAWDDRVDDLAKGKGHIW